MSISIKNLSKILSFALVPLALFLTSGAAIWNGAIHSTSDFNTAPLRLPDFTYQANRQKPATILPPPLIEKKIPSVTVKESQRNIFGFSTVAKKEEEKSLKIMELSLGLIVVQGKQRFCLTNGVTLAEGETGNGFLVHRIEENRVLYKIGEVLLYLHPGDKITVDAKGNIRGVSETEKIMRDKESDLKMNETQVKE